MWGSRDTVNQLSRYQPVSCLLDENMSKQATSLAHVDTEYSADCIEFCPFEGYHDIFVCGTYQVLPPTPVNGEASTSAVPSYGTPAEDSDDDDGEDVRLQTNRTGRLLLFRIGSDESSLSELQRIPTPAILDAKWSPRLVEGQPELAVADAVCNITLYSLDDAQLVEKRRISVLPGSLCLSLEYSHVKRTLVVSVSSGALAFIDLEDPDNEVTEFSAHMYEPWITTFDRSDENGMTVWSGGDDLVLKKWDLEDTSRPVFVNKQFEAGVTTIACSPHTPHLLAVGSYDSTLRLYDSRNARTPLLQISVGGGVWRTKFHPDPARRAILLATMHDGFKVVELSPRLVEGREWDLLEAGDAMVNTRFDGHESLAYGVDWSRAPSKNGESLVVSCSFYDHSMHLWRA